MRYVLQRFVRFVAVFVVVTFLVMVFLRMGIDDPARTMLGGQASDEQIAAVTEKYQLDENYVVQYVYWLKNLVTGDLGRSEIFSTDVTELLQSKIMPTLLIGIYAVSLALLISVPVAVWSAYRRDRPLDKAASFASFGFVAVPQIVLGIVLVVHLRQHAGLVPPHQLEGLSVGRPLGALPELLPTGADACPCRSPRSSPACCGPT